MRDEVDLVEVDSFLDELDREERIYMKQNESNLEALPDEVYSESENVTMKNPNIGLSNVTITEDNETEFASFYEKARNESSRIEKTAVAPGEKGKFQNWGEDMFFGREMFPRIISFWNWWVPKLYC